MLPLLVRVVFHFDPVVQSRANFDVPMETDKNTIRLLA